MKKYLLLTRVIDKPIIKLYYHRVEEEENIPLALCVCIVCNPEEAKQFEKEEAEALLVELNKNEKELNESELTRFEIEEIEID